MKKFVIALIALIAILAFILFLKINGNILTNSSILISRTPTSDSTNSFASLDSLDYSSEDIKKLILKGKESIRKEDNVYYESSTPTQLIKHYYKGSKLKCESYHCSPTASIETAEKSLTTISDFDDHKTDKFDHTAKNKRTVNYTVGSKNLFQEELVDLIEDNRYITKFIYVKDDVLDGKNCIVVKAYRYDAKTYEIKTFLHTIAVYWIEKSTGFYVGRTHIKPNENTFTVGSTIKNLSFGTVKDSDLAEPKL